MHLIRAFGRCENSKRTDHRIEWLFKIKRIFDLTLNNARARKGVERNVLETF
jgi:hypothetical protein